MKNQKANKEEKLKFTISILIILLLIGFCLGIRFVIKYTSLFPTALGIAYIGIITNAIYAYFIYKKVKKRNPHIQSKLKEIDTLK